MNAPAPRATYRLQFHRGFTLRQGTQLVDYLHGLGVSHVYSSPLLKACPGSTHGYDVCDCSQLNPELGTETDFESFVAELRQRGMGLVLDIVPNHMGIGPENPWWWDVLKLGRASKFADYFDVDWDPPDPALQGKVLLPFLGDEYERVLERGELKVGCEHAEVTVRYFDRRFPASPESILVPGKFLEEAVAEFNADRQALDRFLEQQHYRLAFWKQGDARVNYRRFFNIAGLAGLRVELPLVFSDTHNRILAWHQRGYLDGLRVDHPDGLRDPKQYLERLHRAAPETWVIVEKILEPGETLPRDWPVAGTTGYDFLNRVGGLFVDPAGEKPLTDFYAEFTGEKTDYQEVVRDKKRLCLRKLLVAEVDRLTRLLQAISSHRHPAFETADLREVLIELIAAFPVYRTYVQADLPPGVSSGSAPRIGAEDLSHVEQAAAVAGRERPDLDPALFDLLKDLLLLRDRAPNPTAASPKKQEHPATPSRQSGDVSATEREFVMRFQQLTGPAMAKGVEDTTFYCFNRFVALNEVGGDPGRFGLSVEEFHEACRQSHAEWPHTMLATSTHDTKRGEDVRARLGVLSEIPGAWADTVHRWAAMNERHRREGFPDRNAEYLFYQVLVGAWPLSVDRAAGYMEKASREAKQHTSWNDPDPAYDDALKRFVEASLNDSEFVAEVERFVAPLVEPGHVNSLAQTLLKLTAPGVPDLYQGNELHDLTLVDPDNRRPVDYELRRRLLGELAGLSVEQAWQRRNEGLAKLWLIQKVLGYRRKDPGLYGAGAGYEPLKAHGAKAPHVVAFSRGGRVVTVVPRLVRGLADGWVDTTIALPSGTWANELTGESVDGGVCALGELLRQFPVAFLSETFGQAEGLVTESCKETQ